MQGRSRVAFGQPVALSAVRRARRRHAALERADVHAFRTWRRVGHAVFRARSARAAFRGRRRLSRLVSAERAGARLLPFRDDADGYESARRRDRALVRAGAGRLRRRVERRVPARRRSVRPRCSTRCRVWPIPIRRRSRPRCSTPFEWIREELADDTARSVLDAYASSIYKPRLEKLGYRRREGDASTTIALRARLAEFLALDRARCGRAQRARPARPRGARSRRHAARSILSRADSDLLRSALRVTVQEDGARAFDAVQKEFAVNRDTAQRYALLAALGATRDPDARRKSARLRSRSQSCRSARSTISTMRR